MHPYLASSKYIDWHHPDVAQKAAELAAGFTLGLSESTSLYGELGKLWATGGDNRVKSQLNASAGLRVRW